MTRPPVAADDFAIPYPNGQPPMNFRFLVAPCCALVLLSPGQDPQGPASAPGPGRHIGAAMCKNCHNGADQGAAYDHWAQSAHRKAFATLGGDKAKELGRKVGVAEPQESAQCLQCHVTAFGKDKKEFKATFKPEHGVQCESCHGPGETHQKKRFAEAMKKDAPPSPMTPDELIVGRSATACTTCHNDRSPSHKPFCLVESMKAIEHLDPRKQRSEDELKHLRATCAPDCPTCPPKDSAKPAPKDASGK